MKSLDEVIIFLIILSVFFVIPLGAAIGYNLGGTWDATIGAAWFITKMAGSPIIFLLSIKLIQKVALWWKK